jgi:AcrR family transcriptional regulator
MNREETIFGERWPFTKAKSSLLRASSQVMREGGPRAATLKNIAAKAGVTEPAIFRHFDGVDGLFESLFKVVELFFEEFQGYYKQDGLYGLDRLEAAYMDVVASLKTNEDFCYLVVHPDPVFSQYPKLKARLKELKERDQAAVMECIKEAKSKGQLLASVEPEAAAFSLVGSALLVLQAWVADPKATDPLKACRKLWGDLRAVIATAAGRVSKAPKEPRSFVVSAAAPEAPRAKTGPKPKAAGKAAKAPDAKAKPAAKAAKPEAKAKAAPKAAAKTAKAPAAAAPKAKQPAEAKPKAKAKAPVAPKKTKK